jgi:hypothetical protein
MMTREKNILPREAYDALECKRTLCCNQGQPENEDADDKDVYITVRTTVTGTQDTTSRQENTRAKVALAPVQQTELERIVRLAVNKAVQLVSV